MLKLPTEWSELSKSQLESTLRFAELSLASTERIARLQMDVARRALEENAAIAKALADARDPQELFALRTRLAVENSERMLEYSKEVYEAAMQSRAQLLDLMTQSLSGFGKEFKAAAEKAFGSAPVAGLGPFDAVQAMMTAANTAQENLTALAKQATQMVEEGMRVAASGAPFAAGTSKARKP